MDMISVNSKKAVAAACDVLLADGLLVYPTDTCYGLAVLATSSNAVTKLLEHKTKGQSRGVPIAVKSQVMAERYVELSAEAQNLYRQFLPGPLTIVSQSKHVVDNRLEADKGTLAVRIPDHDFVLRLLSELDLPITTTNPLPAGQGFAYSLAQLTERLSPKLRSAIPLMIDGGQLPVVPPSTVIDTTQVDNVVYRQGALQVKLSYQGHSNSAGETEQLAQQLMQQWLKEAGNAPILILLNGSLGAGKTYFAKGIGRALNIAQTINSPSYTYVTEYEFSPGHFLWHLDPWRVGSAADLKLLLTKEMFTQGNIVMIEWASRVVPLLDDLFPADGYLREVVLERTAVLDQRLIRVY